MTELRFETRFHSHELQSLVLPVEIRRPSLALVNRALSNQSVDIAPGLYYVTAQLPAGQELAGEVTVGGDEPAIAILELDPGDVSPSESQEVQRYIVGKPPAPTESRRVLESLGGGQISAKLTAYTGNALLGLVEPIDAEQWFEPLAAPLRGVARFQCRPGQALFAQLIQPDSRPINIALPVAPQLGCEIFIVQQADGGLDIEAHLVNVEADAQLRYYERGFLGEAGTAADAEFFERMLARKMVDPIAATVGAYTLLRLGELDRLHDWTRNLATKFEWLPDGLPIWAEHLARLGEHQSALQTLLGLSERGLPIFGDGLSYAINRLRLYARLESKDLSDTDRGRALELLGRLQAFGAFADIRKAVLTFTGDNLNEPDDEPVSLDIDAIEGLDVAEFMG